MNVIKCLTDCYIYLRHLYNKLENNYKRNKSYLCVTFFLYKKEHESNVRKQSFLPIIVLNLVNKYAKLGWFQFSIRENCVVS